jgi:hypothetical protein
MAYRCYLCFFFGGGALVCTQVLGRGVWGTEGVACRPESSLALPSLAEVMHIFRCMVWS